MTLSKKDQKRMDELMGKSMDIEYDVLNYLRNIIAAKWDAPTLKKIVEKKMKSLDKLECKKWPLIEKDQEPKKASKK